jgi:IS30 family transposase
MTQKEVRRRVAQFISDNPQLSYREIGLKLDRAPSTIAAIAHEHGITRQHAALTDADLTKLLDLPQRGE